MVQVLQASKATLANLREAFGLTRNKNPKFFTEWLALDSAVDEAEISAINRMISNFEYLIEEPPLLEEGVKMVVLAPLLDIAGFYQAPFRIKPELSIEVSLPSEGENEEETVLRGNIDVLVVSKKVWVCAIESKMTTFALNVALPQVLSYMIASATDPCFGLLTNGSEFLFVKLSKDGNPEGNPQFATSKVFSLYAPGNELVEVLKILRHLGQQITE